LIRYVIIPKTKAATKKIILDEKDVGLLLPSLLILTPDLNLLSLTSGKNAPPKQSNVKIAVIIPIIVITNYNKYQFSFKDI
tara:strand:+ start:931 stop:1173 length:243 start_codon:yes stop_codon:yes gene_type:complete